MLSVTVAGYVAGDPRTNEVGGTPVCNFTVLSNYKKGDEDITSAVDVAVWGKRSEVAAKYIKKGSMVTVTGTGHVESYQSSETGKTYAKVVLRATDFTLPPKPAQPEF